ncbi:TetR/AcrR family transcriptional regulator [Nonomuraea sp. NBC_01738]|uniref:TetR/AcrR family transcriptional regulator n=1 Tax=Nonomuraea sp. NBC_01738 TaxID=2976003 RepID=UPI002E11653B|nr:TetR/AcrR family transcriptional regulator [Nonomuraea sp. NBC_01738]
MARPGDTKARIQEAARELFLRKGVGKTSLQDIADQLGITKPALYYHFSSRDDLVRSILKPLVDDGEGYMAAVEAREGEVDARSLLEGYFDFHYKHREVVMLMIQELVGLMDLGLLERVYDWRERLAVLLVGAEPSLARAARATVALGGVADCAVQFHDVPQAELREASVAAGLAALGLDQVGLDQIDR